MPRPAVEDLLDLVKRLPPEEREEFAARFSQWQVDALGDDVLIQTAQRKLPPADQRRLKRLSTRSEFGRLTVTERNEYLCLARSAEQLDARRIQALAELSRRWNLPPADVMKQVGWESQRYGA
jgi:soluble lytic murein transglycosylase-like protein